MHSQYDQTGLTTEQDAQQRAREWIVFLQSDEVSEADQQRFERWLALDERHCSAYQQAQSIWQAASNLTALGSLESLRGMHDNPATDRGLLQRIKRWVFSSPSSSSSSGRSSRAAWPQWGAALASVLLVTLIIGSPQPAPPELIVYQTQTAETRSLLLADGSEVSLSPQSRIEVTYSAAQRQVKLLKGEAFFDVAKNPERPFIVDTRTTRVTVLGTMFNVNNSPHGVQVAVEEGRVQVAEQGAAGRADAEVKLSAGQLINVSQAAGLSQVQAIDPQTVGAWREDVRVYQARPLEQVLEDLDRYHPADLYIVDESLKKLPVTAIFPTKDAQQMLTALESILPISVQAISGGRVEIRAR